MWFRNIFNRERTTATGRLFDETFLRRLERMSLQAQRTLRGRPTGGTHLSRQQLPTSIFSDHRPYSHGDDIRYIDWNAYAHQNEFFVKLGEVEQDINVHLLVDTSRSMAFGSPAKLRSAQQLAAALGYLALTHSDRLTLVPFGGGRQRAFGPTQGKGRVVEMLRFIERMEADQPQSRIAATLRDYAQQHERGGLLVLMSDLFAADNLVEGLQMLPPPRWQILVLHFLSPDELDPPLGGAADLQDSETGQTLELILDSETIAAYRQALRSWRERMIAACAQRGATYAQVLTQWPLERQVVPFLRARRILT
ncbi:MAG TPA: DUF58 domain-containing protein [Roseiflexaceae bacterium]|nr:DUF58 domain-containing protein [Roseiflexaceae bacterium]HMP39803.1 DUF58 domain-containing protein [Roseiflexaceae bacterium]